MPLRDGQIGQIAYINHNIIDQIGKVRLVHFFIPIDDGAEHWFLGTCRSQPSIAGNPVAITGGIVLRREQLDAIDWRSDLLVDSRFDPEPVFKAWLEPIARTGRVDPVHFDEIDRLRGASRPFDHREVAQLINVAPQRMLVVDPQVDATLSGQKRALGHIGGILAATPFERAEELRWATAPVAEPLQWDLATASTNADGKFVEIRVSPDHIEVKGVTDSAWQTEGEWLTLLDRAQSHFGPSAGVAAMLDDHRRYPTIVARLVAFLNYIHAHESANPGNYGYWFTHLLIEFCAALPAAERQPFHEAGAELPVPSATFMRPALEGGAAAPLRRAGHGPAAIARLAKPADEPLALAGLLLEPELAHFAFSDADLVQSSADCANRLALAINQGSDDPRFASLLHSAAARSARERPTPDQAAWLLKTIPPLAADTRRPAEDRLRLQLDCENVLSRIVPIRRHSDKFSRQCQQERLNGVSPILRGKVDTPAIRDFVFAMVRAARLADKQLVEG